MSYIPLPSAMRNSLVIIIIILVSCSGQENETGQHQAPGLDTSIGKEFPTDPDQAQVRKEFIESYSKPIIIDTPWVSSGQKFTLHFKHTCVNNSRLLIPAEYNFDINKDFTTHAFESYLMLKSGGDTVFRTVITKEMFAVFLDSIQLKFATLLYPRLELRTDSIKIDYSVTIPVTDVGTRVQIMFDKNGHYSIGNGM